MQNQGHAVGIVHWGRRPLPIAPQALPIAVADHCPLRSQTIAHCASVIVHCGRRPLPIAPQALNAY
ncbi:MAG TPA: hypothetical protein PLY70_10345 [Saprospiraceae bacterium]|nr:hypothetical protein [Saprospiraceae bacterium]